jgi:hypothetical protein
MKSIDHKQAIKAFTALSPETQAQYQFEQAYRWLEVVLETDQYGLEMLPLQPGFWSWWGTHWNAIDQAFIDSIKVGSDGKIQVRLAGAENFSQAKSEQHLALIWQDYHSIRYVRGNQALIRSSFHTYIKHLVNTKH